MATQSFFLGSATVDLTQSQLSVWREWVRSGIVMISFTADQDHTLPDPTALSIYFLSTHSVPGGISATDVVIGDTMYDVEMGE